MCTNKNDKNSYSRICLSGHLKGNRKSGDLGKQQINMLRPTQTLDPFVSVEAEHLRNKEHKQKGLFGLLYTVLCKKKQNCAIKSFIYWQWRECC